MLSHFNDLPLYDIAVIGGGINGVGIANDAAGRGLSVFFVKKMTLRVIPHLPVVN